MPNEFWRYTSYDAARKRKEQEQAQKPVTPLLPPLTITTPKPKNTLPSWLGASQQTGDTPDWVNAPQAQSTPSWVSPQPALGGETAPLQPEAEPRNPAESRNFRWWEQPTEQEVQQWEEYKVQPTYRPASLGEAIGDIGQSVSEGFQQGKAQQGGLLGGIGGAVSGVLSGQNPIGYGARTIGTSLDALTGSMFGTLDSWTQNGLLTADETAQFKQIYASIDPAIHPQIRAAMARESLPRSTKQKILNIVDWTTQNLAKQASGEFYAGVKGTIEGAKEGYERNGILGAIGGAATGADVGTKDIQGNATGTVRSSIPSYMLNTTLRMLVGGPILAAYGQGIDADIIRRAVTGENGGLINPELYQDIMRNREEWKQVENAAPRAYQFVSEMVTDPINIVSTAMGASAGLMKKSAVAEGAKVSEMALARAAQQGLVTADNLADMQKIAGVVGKAAESASMAKQFTPEFRALLGFSQAIDTAQNKGYLVSLPGDAAIGMYFAQKTYMRYGPKLLGAFAKKLTNLIVQPKVPNMPEVYKTLGDMHYQQAMRDAAEAGVKIPDKTYYLERETNTLQSMPTREYYTKTVQDAMTAPLNIDVGNGKVYPTLGDMVVDYVKRKDYRPEDFLDLTQIGQGQNRARVAEYASAMIPATEELAPATAEMGKPQGAVSAPEQVGRQPEEMGIPERMVAAASNAPTPPLDELIQSELRKQAQQGGGMDLDYEQAHQAAERAVVDDITSNWKDLDEAQRWLDSNDETMEVHLRDDTPVSREAVQEAINRKRGVTPETVVPSAQDVMDSIERAGVFASAYEPDARYMASMEYDGQMAIRKATSLDSVIRAGDEIITLYNPITGTEVGTIDLVNGRATAIRPENQARVENAFEALKKAARDKKINYEIANLRNSPVKNAERIAALEKLKQISLSKSTITTPVAQEVTDVGGDIGNKKQGAQEVTDIGGGARAEERWTQFIDISAGDKMGGQFNPDRLLNIDTRSGDQTLREADRVFARYAKTNTMPSSEDLQILDNNNSQNLKVGDLLLLNRNTRRPEFAVIMAQGDLPNTGERGYLVSSYLTGDQTGIAAEALRGHALVTTRVNIPEAQRLTSPRPQQHPQPLQVTSPKTSPKVVATIKNEIAKLVPFSRLANAISPNLGNRFTVDSDGVASAHVDNPKVDVYTYRDRYDGSARISSDDMKSRVKELPTGITEDMYVQTGKTSLKKYTPDTNYLHEFMDVEAPSNYDDFTPEQVYDNMLLSAKYHLLNAAANKASMVDFSQLRLSEDKVGGIIPPDWFPRLINDLKRDGFIGRRIFKEDETQWEWRTEKHTIKSAQDDPTRGTYELTVKSSANQGKSNLNVRGTSTNIGLSVDTEGVARSARVQYSGNMYRIAIKELLQNSVDASRPSAKAGAENNLTRVIVDSDRRMVMVADEGSGMSPTTVRNALLGWAKAEKPEGATGGKGTAAKALMSNAEEIVYITVGADKGSDKKWITILYGTGDNFVSQKMNEFKCPLEEFDDATMMSAIKEKLPQNFTDMLEQKEVAIPYNGGTIAYIKVLDNPQISWNKVDSDDIVADTLRTGKLAGQDIDFDIDNSETKITIPADSGTPEKNITPWLSGVTEEERLVDESKPVATVPGANKDVSYTIYESKDIGEITSVNVIFRNQGLPQSKTAFQLRGDSGNVISAKLPRTIVVDVDYKGKAGEPGDPWLADRSDLVYPEKKVISEWINKNLASVAQERESAKITEALFESPKIANTSASHADVESLRIVHERGIDPELDAYVQEISQRPEYAKITQYLSDCLDAVVEDSPSITVQDTWGKKETKTATLQDISLMGLGISDKYWGVNVRWGDGKNPKRNLVLVNAFSIIDHYKNESPARIASELLSVNLHEIAHFYVSSGHNADYASALTSLGAHAMEMNATFIRGLSKLLDSDTIKRISEDNSFIESHISRPEYSKTQTLSRYSQEFGSVDTKETLGHGQEQGVGRGNVSELPGGQQRQGYAERYEGTPEVGVTRAGEPGVPEGAERAPLGTELGRNIGEKAAPEPGGQPAPTKTGITTDENGIRYATEGTELQFPTGTGKVDRVEPVRRADGTIRTYRHSITTDLGSKLRVTSEMLPEEVAKPQPEAAPAVSTPIVSATTTFVRDDGSSGTREIGKPVDVFRTAAGTGEESGKTLHIPSHFALGELDDVQPSHMLDTFTPNPKYPQERQGRDYNSVAAKGTVTEGINNPNYRAMVWPAEEVDTGMPLVTSDGAVVNGTNRRLILEGWSRDPQKWAEYQDALAKALPELGLNAADLSKYKKPILYRVVDEGVPESDIMKASRVFQTTKGLNQLEAAKINADVLTKRMLAGLEIGKTPRETFDNPRNQSFIQDYINNQPSTHRGELMNKEGKLTDKAVDEIRDAIFIAVYGKRGEKLLDKFTSSGEAKMVGDALFNSISDLARAEERIKMGMADKELSLVDDIIGSVDHLLQMRRQGMTLDEYVNTKTLFDIGLPEMNKAQKQLLGIWDSIVKGNRVSMREVLKRYASLVSEPLQYDLEGKVVPQTAGQLFSRALGEVGIENVDLDFGPRVQEVFDTGTPANAPSVNYDKPVFDTHKNQDGTYQAEWNKVVNKDGKADVKDTPLISVSNRDWHSYDDKTKRAVIEQMINNSAFASAPNKAEIIDDIIKTTNDWADKYLEVEVKAATGGVPDEVFTGGGKPEQPAQPPQLPAASEGTQPPPQQPVPQQPAGSTGTQPAPQQPAVPGGTGGQGGKPPTQPPAAGAGVQPAPQQPSGGKPSTTLFPLGTAQQGKAQAKAPRAKTQANQQAQMPTAPGKVPPAAQGSSTLFNPQAKSAEIVGEIQARAPWWAKRAAKKGKNIRTLVKLTRGFVPETGAFEKDSLAGAVEGYTLQQAGGIVATAEHYLTDSFSAWKDAGITITANKNGTNQMVDAFRLKPIDQQPAKLRSGADVPDEVRHMSNNLNDILSFPDFFESTAVDPLIKAQQEKALIDTVSLGERMIIELSNEAKSRGIPWDRSRVIADYYFPRAVDNIDDIEPLKYSNDKKFREHITATEGMNRANEPIEYGNVQEAFTTYLRRIADRISAHETFMTLRSLGGKTTEELIDLNTKTNLAVQQGFLDNVGKAEETIKQLALNGDANYGTSPMTMHPEISWVNSVLDPADEFALRVYEMAHETDPATRTLLAKALLGDTNNVGKIYRKAVSDAQKLVEIERNRIINLGRSTRGAMGLPGNANEPVAIASIEKFMGEETLHMPREDAKYVNEWFDSRVSKSNVIARLNDANALSRAVTMSSDLEMVRRLAATFYLHPDVYIKSLIAAFSDEEQMAKWMTSNDVAPYVKLAQKYGINLDASSEAQDAFADIRNGAVYNWMTKKKTYQRLAAFSANPANVAQVLMFKADWNHIQELGIKRAQRLHDTTPEGIERATDYEARGYFRALQDHIGVRSLLGSGTTKLFRTTTRTIFMSGRKTVGTVNAQMNWFKKGAQGETARKLLVGDAMALTASAIALYATHLIVNGKDPEEADHWKEFVDPTSPNFLKVEIGGTRIGPGGTVMTLLDYYFQLGDAVASGDTSRIAKQLPNWWLGRLSPVGNIARTKITGKNYQGVKVEGEDWFSELAPAIIPTTFQDVVLPDVYRHNPAAQKVVGGLGAVWAGKVAGAFAQWIGDRSVSETPSMLLTKARNAASLEAYGKKWDELDQVDKWQLTEAVPDLKLLDKAALERSSEKDNPSAMFELAKMSRYEDIAAKADVYRRQFEVGQRADGTPYSGADYRADLSELDKERAQVEIDLKAGNPVFKDIPVTSAEKKAYYAKYGISEKPVDKFINAWYQCTQDAIVDETTGQIDFEKLFAARDALIVRTSPTVLAKAMPYINRNKNAMIIRAQAVYNTYMNLPKYDGLSKEQAKQVDEFKQEWETLRLASVPNPKQVAAQKFPAGYRMYEARGKQASKARRRFMYRNGKDSSNGYTTNGTLINLFYADLTMADLLEYQPEMASIL